jgi:hypothetical protein
MLPVTASFDNARRSKSDGQGSGLSETSLADLLDADRLVAAEWQCRRAEVGGGEPNDCRPLDGLAFRDEVSLARWWLPSGAPEQPQGARQPQRRRRIVISQRTIER